MTRPRIWLTAAAVVCILWTAACAINAILASAPGT